MLFAGYAASTLSQYPWFLSYVSEYARGRPLYETLVDSNTDWGQGLLALRRFMRERGVDEVGLGYFGSAPPEAYGISYVPMPSFFPLLGGHPGHPRYLAVSATLLTGIGVDGDPYARLRAAQPAAVVGGSLYVFDTATLGRK